MDPLRLESLQRPLQIRFRRVHHGGDGGLAVVGLEKGRSPLAAQGLQQLPHQPHRVAVQGGVVLRRVVLGNGGQAVQAALQIPQDGVHHAGGPGILAVGPGEGHRLVHRRAVGDAGQKQHLVEPQPQGLEHLSLQPPQGDVGELGQVEVQQNAVLNHPEAQLGGQARVPAVQAGGGDLLFQHSVRPAPLPLAGVQGEQGHLTCVHMLLLLRLLCILFLERKRIKKNFGAKLRFAGIFFSFLLSGGPGVPPLQRGPKLDSAPNTGDRKGRPYDVSPQIHGAARPTGGAEPSGSPQESVPDRPVGSRLTFRDTAGGASLSPTILQEVPLIRAGASQTILPTIGTGRPGVPPLQKASSDSP